jgi:hypothetical protein
MQDGIRFDINDVSQLIESGESLLTYHTKQKVAWSPSQAFMPSIDDATQTYIMDDDSSAYYRVAYVLWVRLMKTLSSIEEASTAWVQPGNLPFSSNDTQTMPPWVSKYTGFDISAQVAFDANVKKVGQNCKEGSPTIEYRQCSPNYNLLYFGASRSFNRYVRRRGPPIIQPKTALLWPGLTITHHLSNSVPAWSNSSRPLSQTLAKWVFDESIQCQRGSPDTSVCAENPSTTGQILAVVPWLGGDYNPFESCDTVGSGTLQVLCFAYMVCKVFMPMLLSTLLMMRRKERVSCRCYSVRFL